MNEWHPFPRQIPPHGQDCYVAYRVSNGDGDGSSHLELDLAKYSGLDGWRKFGTGGKYPRQVEYFWMFPDKPSLPA